MDTQIEISLNGKAHSLASDACLETLAQQLGLANKRYAIEVNQEIIPRSEHAEFGIKSGDRIEIVEAIGGG